MELIDASDFIERTKIEILFDKLLSHVPPTVFSGLWILLYLLIAYIIINIIYKLYKNESPKKKEKSTKKNRSLLNDYLIYDIFFKK